MSSKTLLLTKYTWICRYIDHIGLCDIETMRCLKVTSPPRRGDGNTL